MRTSLRRMGNSTGVIIPKPILNEIGARSGDQVDLSVEEGRVVLSPARKRNPREGWAEASKAIAESGERLVWPEFANDDDEKLIW